MELGKLFSRESRYEVSRAKEGSLIINGIVYLCEFCKHWHGFACSLVSSLLPVLGLALLAAVVCHPACPTFLQLLWTSCPTTTLGPCHS